MEDDSGFRAYPISEGLSRIGIKHTNGYKFIKSGELLTYMVGSRRYVTEQALKDFVGKRIEESSSPSCVRKMNLTAEILGVLQARRGPLSTAEISELTGFSYESKKVHKALKALCEIGAVKRRGNNRSALFWVEGEVSK